MRKHVPRTHLARWHGRAWCGTVPLLCLAPITDKPSAVTCKRCLRDWRAGLARVAGEAAQ